MSKPKVNSHQELITIRNHIIDRALIYGTGLGIVVYLLSLLELANRFMISYITDFVVLSALLVVTIYRKRMSMSSKSYIVLAGILTVVLIDVYENGIFFASKVLLILIPFFAVVSLNVRKTVVFAILTLIGMAAFAYMHITGYLSVSINQNQDLVSWLVNLVMISMVAYVVLMIVMKFNGRYEGFIHELTERNNRIKESEKGLAQYKEHLETLVDERTKDLQMANERLSQQTEELTLAFDKLNATKDQLVQSEKMASLGLLASGMAHEINNPLNFIRGGVTRMEFYFKEKLENEHYAEIKQLVDEINDGVSRASRIVTSLNQYGHARDQMIDPCNIHNIMDTCLLMLKNQFLNNISIEKEYADHLPIITGNNGKLHQVFLNLIANAAQAIKGEGKVQILTKSEQGNVIVKISDTGVGIPTEMIGKVADPFYTTKEAGQGLGLGLYITFNIVKEHLGDIHFESETGKGTTVTVILPVRTPEN